MAIGISSLPSLIITIIAIPVTITILQKLRDVYFGPLSRIPGPKLAAATRLVLFYHKARGDAEHWRLRLHEKYGHVVRPSPTDVSFSTGKVWKDIYGTRPGTLKSNMPKDPMFYKSDGAPSLTSAPDEVHTRQRRVFNAAFSERVLTKQEPLLRSYATQFLSNLTRAADGNEKIDIAKNYNFFTFDVMADLTFGEPLGCLQNSAYTEWMTSIFASLTVLTFLLELRYYPYLAKLVSKMIPASLRKKREKNKEITAAAIKKRSMLEVERPDIWGLIKAANDQKDENQQLQPDEMRVNANLFMTAGTETSATLLSALTYYLLKYPDKMQILTKEIRSSFSSIDEITATTIPHLPYMTACIQEALRLFPPVPLGLPHVVPQGGVELCGYYLPENTSVSIHQYSTYRSSRNFARPTEFIPERWLPDPPKEFINDDRSAVHPFSIGPRICLGINFAWYEMRFILAITLFTFDLSLCDESSEWDNQKVFLMWKKDPLMVEVKSR